MHDSFSFGLIPAYFGKGVDEMPVYPAPGYVQYLPNDELGLEYVVIKLGEPWRLF